MKTAGHHTKFIVGATIWELLEAKTDNYSKAINAALRALLIAHQRDRLTSGQMEALKNHGARVSNPLGSVKKNIRIENDLWEYMEMNNLVKNRCVQSAIYNIIND